MEEIEALSESERRFWTPITRDLTAKEKFDAQIRLYAPCGCGSGKKFKFCCRQKATATGSQNDNGLARRVPDSE